MKKLTALLLVFLLSLSITACGNNNADLIKEYEEKIKELEFTIGLLEENITELETELLFRDDEINKYIDKYGDLNSDNTSQENDSTDEETKDPEIIEVTLTTENFFDYFELIEFTTFSEDAFGEIADRAVVVDGYHVLYPATVFSLNVDTRLYRHHVAAAKNRFSGGR